MSTARNGRYRRRHEKGVADPRGKVFDRTDPGRSHWLSRAMSHQQHFVTTFANELFRCGHRANSVLPCTTPSLFQLLPRARYPSSGLPQAKQLESLWVRSPLGWGVCLVWCWPCSNLVPWSEPPTSRTQPSPPGPPQVPPAPNNATITTTNHHIRLWRLAGAGRRVGMFRVIRIICWTVASQKKQYHRNCNGQIPPGTTNICPGCSTGHPADP